MKALGRGLGDIDPLDIEIALGINGEPDVRLRNSASEMAEMRGIGIVRVSMSHEHGLAIAFAMAECIPAGCHQRDTGIQTNLKDMRIDHDI